MELFAVIGILTAYFKYRNAKPDGTLEAKPTKAPIEPHVQKPLRSGAGRLENIAYWLGIEDEW